MLMKTFPFHYYTMSPIACLHILVSVQTERQWLVELSLLPLRILISFFFPLLRQDCNIVLGVIAPESSISYFFAVKMVCPVQVSRNENKNELNYVFSVDWVGFKYSSCRNRPATHQGTSV
jgi:hypothetical protein